MEGIPTDKPASSPEGPITNKGEASEVVQKPEKASVQPLPRWRAIVEQPPQNEKEAKLFTERKAWLSDVFSDKEDDGKLGFSRANLVRVVERGMNQIFTPGNVDKKLESRAHKVKSRVDEILNAYTANEKSISLLDMLGEVKSKEDTQAWKMVGMALLQHGLMDNTTEQWKKASEERHRRVRLGELIGMEAERQHIEWQMAEGKQFDKNALQRVCERYRKYSEGPDIPDNFRTNFLETAERWARRNNIELATEKRSVSISPESIVGQNVSVTPKSPAERGRELIGQIQEAYKNSDSEKGLQTLKELQRGLLERNSGIRGMEQHIIANQLEYKQEHLDAIKENLSLDLSLADKKYSSNFIDNLQSQVQYSKYANEELSTSKGGRVWQAFESLAGLAFKWETNIQVVGFWNATFRPFWSSEKVRQIRSEVSNSMQAVAGKGFNADAAAYHVAEFSMANLNENRSRKSLLDVIFSVNADEDEKLHQEKQPEIPKQDIEDVFYPSKPKPDTASTESAVPKLTADEQRQKDWDETINTAMADEKREKQERRDKFSTHIINRWEANPSNISAIPSNLEIYNDLEPEALGQLQRIAEENNLTNEQYIDQIRDEMKRRLEGYSRAA